jgi:hypothetical protein
VPWTWVSATADSETRAAMVTTNGRIEGLLHQIHQFP